MIVSREQEQKPCSNHVQMYIQGADNKLGQFLSHDI